jgi:hypothetical protein
LIRARVALGLTAVLFAFAAHAAPAPLPMLPSVARVALTSHGSSVTIVQDILLPRGEWKGEALRFHVAYGAPGPRAVDVRLVPVDDGALEPAENEPGEVLATEKVARRSANAHPLLGRETMAGIVVAIPPAALTKALGRSQMAALRVRSLVDAAAPDASGAQSVLVRLGASRGTPLALGRIVSGFAPGTPPVTKIEANLCGPDADAQPLAAHIAGAPRVRASGIAPILAVRHASDDLCLRFWTKRS